MSTGSLWLNDGARGLTDSNWRFNGSLCPRHRQGKGGKVDKRPGKHQPQFEGGVVWVPVTPTDVGEIWLCVKASGGLRSTGDGINDGGWRSTDSSRW